MIPGLHILENRGYDSAGIASMSLVANGSPPTIIATKFASVDTTSDALEKLSRVSHVCCLFFFHPG
jgi:glucosamine 6-phosphate synthetase-like amidotransferase/phosphosugar isomerase protein